MNAITYYSEAIKKVDSGEITIGEYERMINVLRDVEPVVRCRDCKWWHDWNGECYAKEAQGFGHLWEADDYCSFGERKEGERHDG